MRSRSSDDREEEIARLQEQILRLREEEGVDSSAKTDSTVSAATTATAGTSEREEEEEESLADAWRAAVGERKKLENLKSEKRVMLLSEGDLIEGGILENDSNELSGILPAALGAVVAVVFLLLFAQVPVGQEGYQKYSAPTGPTTVKTIDLGDLNPARKE